ncbi:MAG TPA: hypothetical protein VGB49_02560, partial [Caulobacteraceae bacterium]
ALRDFLAERGQAWLEDPGNADSRFARGRARAAAPPVGQAAPDPRPDAGWAVDHACVVHLSPAPGRRLLAAAVACASGAIAGPRGRVLDRLAHIVREGGVATAGGTRIEAGAEILVSRELGRLPPGPLLLSAGQAAVWDGRLEIEAAEPGWTVAALRGRAARLSPADRTSLSAVGAAARPALPVLFRDSGASPLLAWPGACETVRVRPLVAARLAGACGLITHERQVGESAVGEAFTPSLSRD